jgi:hypothetical protein
MTMAFKEDGLDNPNTSLNDAHAMRVVMTQPDRRGARVVPRRLIDRNRKP